MRSNGNFTGLSTSSLALWCFAMAIASYQLGISTCMAQDGFVSVDCGAPAGNYTDNKTSIEWVSDTKANFLKNAVEATSVASVVREPAGNAARTLSSVRYFPGEQSKYCYVFSQNDYDFIQQGSAFLVRASFWVGDLDVFVHATTISFQLLINANIWDDVSITMPQAEVVVKEAYMLPSNSGGSISVCLAPGRGRDVGMMSIPFVSSLELRVLPQEFYDFYTKYYSLPMHIIHTVNYGASSSDVIRYPDDLIDRIWQPDTAHQPSESTTRDASSLPYAPPPPRVLQTAYAPDEQIMLTFEGLNGADTYFVVEYLFETRVLSKGQRVFTWQQTGHPLSDPLDLSTIADSYTPLLSGKVGSLTPSAGGQLEFNITKTGNSTYGPLISALQLFRDFDIVVSLGSNSADVEAIEFIQTTFFKSLMSWTGDPCLPYPYNWLNCTNDPSPRVLNLMLSNRSLEGTIPLKIASLKSLVGIFLDHNKLSGPIPDLSRLANLQTLNLSNNNLSGTIPTFLADLPSLTTLLLDNNNFNGSVPQQLLKKFNGDNLKFSFSGNPLLCSGSNCMTNPESKKSNVGLVAGLVSIVVATILIVIVLVILYLKRRHGKRSHRLLTRVEKRKECTSFTYSEVKAITNDFRKQLAAGGFGPVYYGELPDQRPVAVKVLSAASHQGEREFLNEVDLLSRIHHKNLVTLLGYCVEENLVLIYEYMANGSLVQALQGNHSILNTWKDYLIVAVDAAEGLEYLHNGCYPEIIHRDVKSSNILLSQEMRGKLSDFGISKSKVSTTGGTESTLKGSHGYIDPEYAQRYMVTQKTDVYAFGVVLLEICTGRAVLTQQPDGELQHIADWVKVHVEAGNIHEVMSLSFNGRYNLSAASRVINVAMRCAEFESKKRPNMNEVCSELKSALAIELQGEEHSSDTFSITSEIYPR